MSDERIQLDRDTEWWLAELCSTPVGRRWLLKAGFGSAAAAYVGAWSAPVADAARRVRAGVSGVRLQFALRAASGVSDLVLVANGEQHPLVAHTAASRSALRAQAGLWAKVDLGSLTHFVEGVSLPTGRAVAVRVQGRRGRREVLVALLWHCPEETIRALASVSHRLKGSLRGVVGSNERLAALGIRAAQISSPQEVAQLDIIVSTYTTSVALVMHHPNVGTVDSTASGATNALLLKNPEVSALGSYIDKMQRRGRDFATLVQAVDADGSPSQITVGDTTTTFKTIRVNRDDRTFVDAHRSALNSGIRAVRDDANLGAVIDKPLAEQDDTVKRQTWIQSQGLLPRSTAYSRALAGGAGLDIKVKNPGDVFGTTTQVSGTYDKGRVPLKISNDYVRWMWAYVQYLGKDNQVLPATPGGKYPDPNAKAPDTQYAQSLGLLPQVFTIYGVPLGAGTNTIDVSLNFPEGAHTARLLFCGLGSDINGGWREYFPSDAYPGRIAPSDEVLAPALMTGILTIGLTVFAVGVDFDVAKAWAALRKGLLEGVTDPAAIAELTTLVNRVIGLTSVEALSMTVAGGGALYQEVATNGGATNLWTILVALGTVIVKVIFNPRSISRLFAAVAPSILSVVAATKVLEALPTVGLVVSVLELAGDVATLAEVCAESVICPWVIENEVTLTYKASVTVSHDPCAASFPPAAKSWRLEAKVDGALVLDPVTGSINPGGTGQSTPVQADVVAPFGGKQIQWSMVLLDGTGSQVAAGVSAGYVNDDPDDVPSKVAFSIKQNPAVITARTVFQRGATTTFSAAAGGYSWSDRVVVGGTVASAGIQEVAGAAVATTLGVAGMVWKQGDRFFLRGVPVVQNGKTIELGSVRKEGYARRPFLLFDSFVDVTKCDEKASGGGNHVLLEPDETSDAYEVRKLTLDSHNGRLDWDPGTSLGRFLLPVSAAALHSSGRVVALHTDSGRVGRIEPLSAPLAVGGTGIENTRLASYTGGPGTQIGLLDSPIAVAITNPGTVVILEAAGPQLAALDLNGNPVPYFAPSALRSSHPRRSRRRLGSPSLEFTLPLDPTKTYLDVAVDGASQIYLLYYTGDGSGVQDYHLDVYHPDGTPLDTSSPGVNVPRIAVDYWRSIYAPNYQPLTDLGTTTPHIDPTLRVAEPSLSRFDPTTPARARRPSRIKTRPRTPTRGLG